MEQHQATEVSYAGDEVVARCACGHEETRSAASAGTEADAEARAALAEHVEEANA